MLSNKAFDVLRFLSEIAITALGTLYFALSDIWGLPYGEQILATCAAISTFLGVFVEYERRQFNKAQEEAE